MKRERTAGKLGKKIVFLAGAPRTEATGHPGIGGGGFSITLTHNAMSEIEQST